MKRLIFILCLFASLSAFAHEESISIASKDRKVELISPKQVQALSDEELEQAIQTLLNKQPNFELPKADLQEYDELLQEYEFSPDKRQSNFHDWLYFIGEDEFDDKVFYVASLKSTDENAILYIAYNQKDRQYKNPEIGIILSGEFDGQYLHNFVCLQDCPNIDLNVDGKKHQNIKTNYGGGKTLIIKNPKTFLNHIKNGETIKIRMPLFSGDLMVYVFEPDSILNLQSLKELK